MHPQRGYIHRTGHSHLATPQLLPSILDDSQGVPLTPPLLFSPSPHIVSSIHVTCKMIVKSLPWLRFMWWSRRSNVYSVVHYPFSSRNLHISLLFAFMYREGCCGRVREVRMSSPSPSIQTSAVQTKRAGELGGTAVPLIQCFLLSKSWSNVSKYISSQCSCPAAIPHITSRDSP